MQRGKNFGSILVGSFNPSFYKEIALQSIRKSLKYLLLLVFLLALVLSTNYTILFKKVSAKAVKWINTTLARELEGLPEIKIENGIVSSSIEPFIRTWENNAFAFIVDTSEGEGDPISLLGNYGSAIMFTKDKLIFKTTEKGKTKLEIHTLSNIKSLKIKFGNREEGFLTLTFDGRVFHLTSEKVNRWAKLANGLTFFILLPGFFLYHLITKLSQLFLFSLFSLIAKKFAKANLSYANLLNIGILALSPPVMLATLFQLTRLSFPPFWVLYCGIYVAFLLMAVLRCRTGL